MTFAFHVKRPYHTPVLSIETDCPQIYRLYQIWEGMSIFPGLVENSFHAAILRDEQGYRLTVGDDTYRTDRPMDLLQDLYWERMDIDGGFFPIHGGAVACGGSSQERGAVVFAGATGKGKTTLTAYLSMQGYPYITDDIVFVRKEDFQVFPYPKPIHLRPGGYAALQAQGSALPSMDFADTVDSRYCYTPACPQEAPLPLRAVYFTEYSEQNSLNALNSADAMELLLKSPVHQQNISASYLTFLISLFRKADFGLLCYRDFAYVESILSREAACHD